MARDDDLRPERDDCVERGDPLVVGTFPADRRAAAEENIPREHDALVRKMHDYVAGRVRRPNVEKLHCDSIEVEDQPIVDQVRRRAEIDGASAAIVPVDLALMGVTVPAGSHELVVSYRSTWFAWGLALSMVAWAATITALMWLRPR